MADRIVTAEKADRTPNWDKWRLIPSCTLWECVALSLNIDPDKVHKEWLEINLVIKESRKFNDRIAVALANAGDTGALRPTTYTRDSKCWAVSLREFAAWVHRIGWEAPPELLAIADQRPQNINWNYWATLDLWPLAAACKLVCGVDPEESTLEDDIENIANPNSRTRLPWVNLFHQAQAAIMAEKLKLKEGCVYPAEFIVWARREGVQIPTQLLAIADDHNGTPSDTRTVAAASKRTKKTDRLDDLRQFIDDVYAAANRGDFALEDDNGRKPLPMSKEDLYTLFRVRHPEHEVAQATFDDDLGKIATIKPGPKRITINTLAEMLAGKVSG